MAVNNAIVDLVEQIALSTAAIEALKDAHEREARATTDAYKEMIESNRHIILRAERMMGHIEGQSALETRKQADREQRNATLVRWGNQLVDAVTHWSNGPGARLAESKTAVIIRTTIIAGLGAFGGGVGTVLVGVAGRHFGWV